jgi:hypothetical protein
MCKQKGVEASGVFWNLWESGCMCGYIACRIRWSLTILILLDKDSPREGKEFWWFVICLG